MTYTVTLEPVGIEMEVEEGETILEAAFRQGIALMHGCKEGQCSTCKSVLLDGDVELKKYSTFALPDFERNEGYILLCRSLPETDLTVELLQYDEEALKVSVPVRTLSTVVESIQPLTHDIRKLTLKLDNHENLTFHAGQFVDIYIPGTDSYRSYSMANTPSQSDTLEFMVKIFTGGKFSTLLDEQLKAGDYLDIRGPFGNCILTDESDSEIYLIGGGSGMAPLWSIVNDLCQKGRTRKVTFFYGARSKRDLFYLDQFDELSHRLSNFRFIPALSEPTPEDDWDGETGLITEVVERFIDGSDDSLLTFLCGPAPMIDATIQLLRRKGIQSDHILFDKFVPSST